MSLSVTVSDRTVISCVFDHVLIHIRKRHKKAVGRKHKGNHLGTRKGSLQTENLIILERRDTQTRSNDKDRGKDKLKCTSEAEGMNTRQTDRRQN